MANIPLAAKIFYYLSFQINLQNGNLQWNRTENSCSNTSSKYLIKCDTVRADFGKVWKRWVRFRGKDGNIYGGEPANPDIDGTTKPNSYLNPLTPSQLVRLSNKTSMSLSRLLLATQH
jgi:hypothetical protein